MWGLVATKNKLKLEVLQIIPNLPSPFLNVITLNYYQSPFPILKYNNT